MLNTIRYYLNDWFEDWRLGLYMAFVLLLSLLVGHTRALMILFPIAVIPSLLGYSLLPNDAWVYLMALIGIPNGLGFAHNKIKYAS